MSTILARQLQSVQAEQRPRRGRVSLLYNDKQAESVGTDTIADLGKEGFMELCRIDKRFRLYQETLFNENLKSFDRDLQTKETNERLNESLKVFLRLLSPFLLLKASHKVLEYLIRRFKIYVYNVDDTMACILPHHETAIFARMVQVLQIKNTKWQFLNGVQQTGVPLESSILQQMIVKDAAVRAFVAELALTSARPELNLDQPITFYATLFMRTISSERSGVNNTFVSEITPFLIKGLRFKDSPALQSANMTIIAHMGTKFTFSGESLDAFVASIAANAREAEPNVQQNAVDALVALLDSQASIWEGVNADTSTPASSAASNGSVAASSAMNGGNGEQVRRCQLTSRTCELVLRLPVFSDRLVELSNNQKDVAGTIASVVPGAIDIMQQYAEHANSHSAEAVLSAFNMFAQHVEALVSSVPLHPLLVSDFVERCCRAYVSSNQTTSKSSTMGKRFARILRQLSSRYHNASDIGLQKCFASFEDTEQLQSWVEDVFGGSSLCNVSNDPSQNGHATAMSEEVVKFMSLSAALNHASSAVRSHAVSRLIAGTTLAFKEVPTAIRKAMKALRSTSTHQNQDSLDDCLAVAVRGLETITMAQSAVISRIVDDDVMVVKTAAELSLALTEHDLCASISVNSTNDLFSLAEDFAKALREAGYKESSEHLARYLNITEFSGNNTNAMVDAFVTASMKWRDATHPAVTTARRSGQGTVIDDMLLVLLHACSDTYRLLRALEDRQTEDIDVLLSVILSIFSAAISAQQEHQVAKLLQSNPYPLFAFSQSGSKITTHAMQSLKIKAKDNILGSHLILGAAGSLVEDVGASSHSPVLHYVASCMMARDTDLANVASSILLSAVQIASANNSPAVNTLAKVGIYSIIKRWHAIMPSKKVAKAASKAVHDYLADKNKHVAWPFIESDATVKNLFCNRNSDSESTSSDEQVQVAALFAIGLVRCTNAFTFTSAPLISTAIADACRNEWLIGSFNKAEASTDEGILCAAAVFLLDIEEPQFSTLFADIVPPCLKPFFGSTTSPLDRATQLGYLASAEQVSAHTLTSSRCLDLAAKAIDSATLSSEQEVEVIRSFVIRMVCVLGHSSSLLRQSALGVLQAIVNLIDRSSLGKSLVKSAQPIISLCKEVNGHREEILSDNKTITLALGRVVRLGTSDSATGSAVSEAQDITNLLLVQAVNFTRAEPVFANTMLDIIFNTTNAISTHALFFVCLACCNVIESICVQRSYLTVTHIAILRRCLDMIQKHADQVLLSFAVTARASKRKGASAKKISSDALGQHISQLQSVTQTALKLLDFPETAYVYNDGYAVDVDAQEFNFNQDLSNGLCSVVQTRKLCTQLSISPIVWTSAHAFSVPIGDITKTCSPTWGNILSLAKESTPDIKEFKQVYEMIKVVVTATQDIKNSSSDVQAVCEYFDTLNKHQFGPSVTPASILLTLLANRATSKDPTVSQTARQVLSDLTVHSDSLLLCMQYLGLYLGGDVSKISSNQTPSKKRNRNMPSNTDTSKDEDRFLSQLQKSQPEMLEAYARRFVTLSELIAERTTTIVRNESESVTVEAQKQASETHRHIRRLRKRLLKSKQTQHLAVYADDDPQVVGGAQLVAPLFSLIRMNGKLIVSKEEMSGVFDTVGPSFDYSIQLLLNALHNIALRWDSSTDVSESSMNTPSTSLSSSHSNDQAHLAAFDVDVVVACIEQDSPAVRNAALLLLASLSALRPIEVLTRLLRVFTTFDSSTLARDDTYTFSLLQKMIECVIPPIALHGPSVGLSPLKLMRVFVARLDDIPLQRRMPLFEALISNMSNASAQLELQMNSADSESVAETDIDQDDENMESELQQNGVTKRDQRSMFEHTRARFTAGAVLLLVAHAQFEQTHASSDESNTSLAHLTEFARDLVADNSAIVQIEIASVLGTTASRLLAVNDTDIEMGEEDDQQEQLDQNFVNEAVGICLWQPDDVHTSKLLTGKAAKSAHSLSDAQRAEIMPKLLEFAGKTLLHEPFLRKLAMIRETSGLFHQIQVRELSLAQRIFAVLRTLSATDVSSIISESRELHKYRTLGSQAAFGVLESLSQLLSPSAFVAVVHTLLHDADPYIRRRSLAFLNAKIVNRLSELYDTSLARGESTQASNVFVGASAATDTQRNGYFTTLQRGKRNGIPDDVTLPSEEITLYLDLLPDLSSMIVDEDEPMLNRQTAILSIDVLVRHFGHVRPKAFKRATETISRFVTDSNRIKSISNLLSTASETNNSSAEDSEMTMLAQTFASGVLTLATVASTTSGTFVAHVPHVLPMIVSLLEIGLTNDSVKIVKSDINSRRTTLEEAAESVHTAALAVIGVLSEHLPNFLAPYFDRLLRVLLDPQVFAPQVVTTQRNHRAHLAQMAFDSLCERVPLRIMLAPLLAAFSWASKRSWQSVLQLSKGLGIVITNMGKSDIKTRLQQVFNFLLKAFDYRWQRGRHESVGAIGVSRVEESLLSNAVELILKLSETQLRPLFLRLLQWRSCADEDLAAAADVEEFWDVNGHHDAAATVPDLHIEDTQSRGKSAEGLQSESRWAFASLCRRITFYHLLQKLTANAKSIFVPFYGFVLQDMVVELADLAGAKSDQESASSIALANRNPNKLRKQLTLDDAYDDDGSSLSSETFADDLSDASTQPSDTGHSDTEESASAHKQMSKLDDSTGGVTRDVYEANASVRHHSIAARAAATALEHTAVPVLCAVDAIDDTVKRQVSAASDEIAYIPSAGHSLRCLVLACLQLCFEHDVDGFMTESNLDVVLKPLTNVFQIPVSYNELKREVGSKKLKRGRDEDGQSSLPTSGSSLQIRNSRSVVTGCVPIPSFAMIEEVDHDSEDEDETETDPIIDSEQLRRKSYMGFAQTYLVPTVAFLAVAVGKDMLWKRINHSILLLTRESAPYVVLAALHAAFQIYHRLGEDVLVLLPETLPYLSECMEHNDADVERFTHSFLRELETMSGEDLQQYLS